MYLNASTTSKFHSSAKNYHLEISQLDSVNLNLLAILLKDTQTQHHSSVGQNDSIPDLQRPRLLKLSQVLQVFF